MTQFLPLLLMPVLIALLAKTAAFVFRRTQLRWLQALVFGILVLLMGGVGTALNRTAGPLPPVLSVLLGLAAVLLVGGWYLGSRAKTANGAPLQFKGGALLSLVLYGLVMILGTCVAVLVPLLQNVG